MRLYGAENKPLQSGGSRRDGAGRVVNLRGQGPEASIIQTV